MGQRLLTLRVRPPRLAVLLNETATPTEFLIVLRFLSQVWGGRFHPILPVNPETPDPLTAFRLGQIRPEFVFGRGLNDEVWNQAVQEACQPRGYVTLEDKFAEDVRKADRLNLLHSDQAIIARLKARSSVNAIPRRLKVVKVNAESEWGPYVASLFGFPHIDVGSKWYDEKEESSVEKSTDLISSHLDFVESWKESWLDAGSFGLSSNRVLCPELDPTIVLVQEIVRDLSHFWNLRRVTDTGSPAWVIPIPFNEASDPVVLRRIHDWLLSFLRYERVPNYCVVTSAAINREAAQPIMEALQSILSNTCIKYVDYEPVKNSISQIVPFEYALTWPGEIQNRRLTIMPPAPKVITLPNSSDAWIVDILKDNKTGRAIQDMQLPESPVVHEILNSPCPPLIERSIIPRFGDGPESINIRCSSGKETIQFCIPTPQEVLEELLIEFGYEVLRDEKRSSYLPTIKRFGSLHRAATAVSGDCGKILNLLKKGPRHLCQIKAACELGKGNIPGKQFVENIEQWMIHESERQRRVGKKRFEDYTRNKAPEKTSVNSLLEHWANTGIVSRSWELGPCGGCGQTSFVSKLDIQKAILCPNCGNRVSLKDKTRIAYSLTHPVLRAMEEGFAPVILAGRFLHNLTDRGFFWLPGLKYKKGDSKGDIDVIACCDGLLIFGECKRLKETSDDAVTWESVIQQFLGLAAVALECKATMIFLAAQVEEFPEEVRNRIEKELFGRIPYLLLNNSDLENGHRPKEGGEEWMWLRTWDLIPVRFPETFCERSPGVRQIKDRVSIYTKGGWDGT